MSRIPKEKIQLYVSQIELDAYKDEAKRLHMDLSLWIRLELNKIVMASGNRQTIHKPINITPAPIWLGPTKPIPTPEPPPAPPVDRSTDYAALEAEIQAKLKKMNEDGE